MEKGKGKEGKGKRVGAEYPVSPVVRIPCFHVGGAGLIPSQGTRILHATTTTTKAEACRGHIRKVKRTDKRLQLVQPDLGH